MRRFDLNSARTCVGRNVNVHLKDGSVLVNVLVTEAIQRKNADKGAALRCTTPTKRKTMKVPLGEIEWTEQLDPYPLSWH